MRLGNFRIATAFDAIMSVLPEWTKLGSFREIRRGILDRPKLTIANRRKGVGPYAAFCCTAPYVLVAFAIWSIDLTTLLPPDPVQRMYTEVRNWETEIAEMRGEFRVTCDTAASMSASAGRRCQALMSRAFDPLQDAADRFRQETQVFETARLGAISSLVGTIAILLNAFFFTRIWLRFYPYHVHKKAEDVDRVWRAYILVMATTMFIPNCIGAIILFVVNIVTRFEPATVGPASNWLMAAGFLPFAVCGVLGCYRLNQILLDSSDWRIGKTWFIILASNAATVICLYSVIVIAIIIYIF